MGASHFVIFLPQPPSPSGLVQLPAGAFSTAAVLPLRRLCVHCRGESAAVRSGQGSLQRGSGRGGRTGGAGPRAGAGAGAWRLADGGEGAGKTGPVCDIPWGRLLLGERGRIDTVEPR